MPTPKLAIDQLRENLQSILKERNINQSELARQTGVQQTFINRIIRKGGEAPSPSIDKLDELASALGLTVGQLLSSNFVVPHVEIDNSEPTSPLVARQLGRLIEDFLLCDAVDRKNLVDQAFSFAIKAKPDGRQK